jgi:pimeloyl-ACP methyl ester carboxylesterase
MADVTEAGDGAPIVCVPGAGGPTMTRALDLLAERFRVLVVELSGGADQADDIADAIDALGLEAYHLLGSSLGAAAALDLVTRHPERVISLTLEAPAEVGLDDELVARLRGVTTRTLILVGDSDDIIDPTNGPTLRAAMPNAVLIYVYNAAHDIQGDRPEAFADVVGDFIRRGMNFLVNDADGLINP